jgi:bacillithiol synthase
MDPACVRHTEIPGSSRLFLDLLYHFDRVKSFYAHPPTPAAVSASAAQVSYPDDRRQALVAALRVRNGDNHPALETLAQPGSVAVVTGQQVGLFSGPAYTVYKAITAAKLARRLAEQGTPAVPVFWLATEDHDFEEINHAWVFNPTKQPVRLAAAYDNRAHTPVGHIPLPDALPLDELRTALEEFPFGGEIAAAVAQAYVPGRPFGAAFQSLLERLLKPLGLLFLDPLDPAIRRLAAPLLASAVEAADALGARLLERKQDLEARGYHAQVHIEPQTSLFFLLDGPSRLTLKRRNGRYTADRREFSTADLAARADHLSPNAVLRPVVQDYLLPTAAYIGGPAELAYMAQSGVLYGELLHRMPVVMPRSGFTLLDARAAKLFHRYGLEIADFSRGEHALREKIAARLIPAGLDRRFEATEAAVAEAVAALRADVAAFDPTLGTALDSSAAKIRHQLSKTRRKTARETLRRDERAAAEAGQLASLVYPHKHLQERFYSILPFLAQHGPDLVERLYETVRLECPDHVLLAV